MTITSSELTKKLIADAKNVWPIDFYLIEEMFNRCCAAMSLAAIRRFDLFTKQGDFETFDSIREKVKLFQDAEYVMLKILDILCDEDVLKYEGHGWRCEDPDPYIDHPAEILVEAVRRFPEEGAAFQWLARAQDGLTDFLCGKLYGEEVMFPNGSFKLVEEVYFSSKVYGFYSRLAARAVKRIVDSCFNRPVTCLEVGAGTGNGTENVFQQTSTAFKKYLFTDVSKSLVQMGQRRFKKRSYNFLEYKSLDICGDIQKQGFKPKLADIILAVNVLHATDSIADALRGAKELLRPGGWLIISEIAPPPKGCYRYMELTFGLLPSYSVYTDTDVRIGSPIVRPDVWITEFEKAGFEDVCAIPGSADPIMDRGGVILARIKNEDEADIDMSQ